MPFRLDKSRIPAEKLSDPRITEWEKAICAAMEHPEYRRCACLHEAAHAIYFERAGAKVALHLPVASYDAQNDTFDFGTCTVQADFGPVAVKVNGLAMARWAAAGRIAMECLLDKGQVEKWGFDESDGQDFQVFCAQWQKYGLPAGEMMKCWEQAQRDVKKDLRSPAFRQQLWERARSFEREMLLMASEPSLTKT